MIWPSVPAVDCGLSLNNLMLRSNVQVLTKGWYEHQDIAALKDRLFRQTAQAKNHYKTPPYFTGYNEIHFGQI